MNSLPDDPDGPRLYMPQGQYDFVPVQRTGQTPVPLHFDRHANPVYFPADMVSSNGQNYSPPISQWQGHGQVNSSGHQREFQHDQPYNGFYEKDGYLATQEGHRISPRRAARDGAYERRDWYADHEPPSPTLRHAFSSSPHGHPTLTPPRGSSGGVEMEVVETTIKAIAKKPNPRRKPVVAGTPNTAPKAPRAAPKRTTGFGSRSHANRRKPGGSDEEIGTLSAKDAAVAAAPVTAKSEMEVSASRKVWTEQHKVDLVKFATKDFANFKANQMHIFLKASETLFDQTKTPEQVKSCWRKLWSLFRAVRAREGHTGGGDGDVVFEDDESEDGEDDSSKGDKLPDDAEREDGDATEVKVKMPKRKKKTQGFSQKQLDAFQLSDAFAVLNNVARKHPEAVKMLGLSSNDSQTLPSAVKKEAEPLDHLSSPAGTNRDQVDIAIIDHLAKSRKRYDREADTAAKTEDRELKRLKMDEDRITHEASMAERRDAREARMEEIERAHREVTYQRQAAELKALQMKERRDREALQAEQWSRVAEWSESPNAVLRAHAARLSERLQKEELEELELAATA